MPASKPNAPSKAFEAELSARLRQRGRELLAGQTEVLQILQQARAQILETLAGLPADWQQWHLSRLLGQIEDVLTGATGQAGTLFTQRMTSAWEAGELLIERPLELVAPGVRARFAQLDVGVLKQMQSFGALRLKDVGSEAARKIGRQLGLVTIGAQTPFESIKAVQKVLGAETPARAATIVHTEVSRAFAVASQQRLDQAASVVPGLGKQWRRSGKIHSRWNHDIMDGQVVAADKPFRVPNPNGGADLMQGPHDPKAPPEQVIRCGCVALPWMKQWEVSTPGAKPFTDQELRKDPSKAQLDRQAKNAGARTEVLPELPHAAKAVIPPAKLAGYALNPDHPIGGNKARVLASALGYTQDNADELSRQLMAGIKGRQATSGKLDQHGQRWEVSIPVTGPKGAGTVLTAWIVRPGEDAPQLTTAYLAKEPRKTS